LREALGDSAENPRYVETLARRGYRFARPVETVHGSPAELVNAIDGNGLSGDLSGRTISHYLVLEKLGGGGMGVVYRAQDLKLGRHVALKFLPPELAGDSIARGRFQREARAASALNHPNICTIYRVEECAGQPVIVMELLEGETLEARLAKGPLPPDKALALAIQMAAALDAAHRKSIVHRDLKPANVVLTNSGLKVLDFGLAKMEGASGMYGGTYGTPAHVTREGAILGTLHYMSPEQVQGKDAGAVSDIFSFGVVLYEMLSGQRAFGSENPPRDRRDSYRRAALACGFRRGRRVEPGAAALSGERSGRALADGARSESGLGVDCRRAHRSAVRGECIGRAPSTAFCFLPKFGPPPLDSRRSVRSYVMRAAFFGGGFALARNFAWRAAYAVHGHVGGRRRHHTHKPLA
jgi:serine/threonine protein kinase